MWSRVHAGRRRQKRSSPARTLGCVCCPDAGYKAQNYPSLKPSPPCRAVASSTHPQCWRHPFCVTINIISNSSKKMVLHLLGVLFFLSLNGYGCNWVFIHHCVRLHPCGKGCGRTQAGGDHARRYLQRHGLLHIFFFFTQLPSLMEWLWGLGGEAESFPKPLLLLARRVQNL